jgi:hypothetical protein
VTRAFLAGAGGILRAGSESIRAEAEAPWRRAVLYLAIAGGFYGALMGTYGGFGGDRPLVILFSALKVPLLLVVTFLVCLPSFFVLNTLFGLRDDFATVFRALVLTQAGLTIILLSCAPITLFWYASVANYDAAILFNSLMFGVSSVAAQWLLRRLYQPLIARNPHHRSLMRVWLVLYAFVGIQTAWTLRPFIGNPAQPAQFFRSEAWGNAYVEVVQKVVGLLRE